MELPADESLRWIVRNFARLRSVCGEVLGVPVLVQPTAAFFPDEFRGDVPGVAGLLRRIMTYAPIASDLRIELSLTADDASPANGCGSGACGAGRGHASRPRHVEELSDGYRVFVGASDLSHPDLLTASLARSVGAIVIHEASEESDGEDAASMAEVAAAVCGLGVVLTNGAAVWGKSCGGLRLASATAMSVEEAAVALSLFVAVHEVDESQARKHLNATQREAFDVASGWTASNPLIVGALRERPALLETGIFSIEPVRGLLGRWLHMRRIERETRAAPTAAKTSRSEAQMRRFDEVRALVDEVLGEE